MKLLKDTFQQSFMLHNYWELRKKARAQAHAYSHVHINAHTSIHTRTNRHNFIHTNVTIYTSTDKNLLQLKQNLYIKVNCN